MSRLGFQVSRGVRNTIAPPISTAQTWGLCYKPTAQRPLLNMSQGVPGTPPPGALLTSLAAAAKLSANATYGNPDGELELRTALAQEMKLVYGSDIEVEVEDVAITAGCNLAFVAAIQTIADAGDEVVLPSPWYFNHEMALCLLGITCVPLPNRPEEEFAPSIERCAGLITSKTRAIVLVTPNNPTGVVYSPDTISAFAKLARESNIALILDETYRDYADAPPHFLFNDPSWREKVIHLFSFSKSYHIPGHRLGAIVDTIQVCPGVSTQLALAKNLPSMRQFIEETSQELRTKHAFFREKLPATWRIAGVEKNCVSRGGVGYFAFVKHPFEGIPSIDVCMRLAKELGVITLPATFFAERGSPFETTNQWIRFSVANVGEERIVEVCTRLEEAEELFGWKVEV